MDNASADKGHQAGTSSHDGVSDDRQPYHQAFLDLLNRVHMFNFPEDRQRLITKFLAELPDVENVVDERFTWQGVANDLDESCIEEVLKTLLYRGGKRCYDSEQVKHLLASARVRFPVLYERERARAISRGRMRPGWPMPVTWFFKEEPHS